MEEKRNLYFQRSNGEHRMLKEKLTEQEAVAEMKKFLDMHNFTSYYTRTWEEDGVKFFDVGSHTEFFKWTNKELV